MQQHIHLIVYVDDIILTGHTSTQVDAFIQTLVSRFSLKDLGELYYFVGVQIVPTPTCIFLGERKYIIGLLARMGIIDAKPTPMPIIVT